MTISVAFQWSGGKDSAFALGRLLGDERYVVRRLLTTVDDGVSTVHGVPRHLLQAQADAIGLPIEFLQVSQPDLHDYRDVMAAAGRRLQHAGIDAVAFGDLDHAGLMPHREEVFEPLGLHVVQPLAGMEPGEYLAAFLESHIEAIVVVIDGGVLDRAHLGAKIDQRFLAALPAGCDPSGELGEYHSFVTNAPYFQSEVLVQTQGVEKLTQEIGTSSGPQTFTFWRLRLA